MQPQHVHNDATGKSTHCSRIADQAQLGWCVGQRVVAAAVAAATRCVDSSSCSHAVRVAKATSADLRSCGTQRTKRCQHLGQILNARHTHIPSHTHVVSAFYGACGSLGGMHKRKPRWTAVAAYLRTQFRNKCNGSIANSKQCYHKQCRCSSRIWWKGTNGGVACQWSCWGTAPATAKE